VIVEPVELGGGRVDPEEVRREPAERRRLEVVDLGLEIASGDLLRAPDVPGEGVEMEDASVEGRLLHLLGVPAHERRIRLVPAELDELLPAVLEREREEEGREHGVSVSRSIS
jgi:hypothetical protein